VTDPRDENPPAPVGPARVPGPRRDRDPWRHFVLVFVSLAVLAELVYYGVALESALFRLYLETLARISGAILKLFAQDVSVRGTLIYSAQFSVEIARGCDAYRICALFSAAVIAFPAAWRARLFGLALGLIWLNLWNFVRIVGLCFIGGHWPGQFQAAHQIYFPIFLICMTLVAWMLWISVATREGLRAGTRRA
jgi:exosortase/archaeosortase family protein